MRLQQKPPLGLPRGSATAESKLDWRRGAISFLTGAVAGGTDSIFTMPFDTVKTQMQNNKQMGMSVTGAFRTIFVRDGITGFYRGYTPFLVMAAGKAAARWGSFRVLYDVVDSLGFDRSQNVTFWTITCGMGAGTFEALIWTAPAERLKVLRQLAAGTGQASTPYREIMRVHGVLGLWTGWTPTAMRSGTNAAIRFTIAGHVKDAWRLLSGVPAGEPLPFHASFMAGGTGGAISVVMNNPVDVIKTKMQSGGGGKGWLACYREIVANRGFRAFGAGISARVPQIFLSQAIQFVVADQLFSLMKA